MRKPELTVIAPYKFLPARMGGQRAIAFLYTHVGEHLPVKIISVAENESPREYNFSVDKSLGSSKLRYINPLLFFRVKKIMKASGSKQLMLIHPYFGWLGIMLKWLTGIQLSVQTQNIEGERFKTMGKWWWPILWQYEKFTHRQADENFFITEEDRDFALENFKLRPELCHVITYGFDLKERPADEARTIAHKALQQQYNIADDEKILLFNGSLNYYPNQKALRYILEEILPRLKKNNFKFRMIICGSGLDDAYNNLKAYSPEVIYAGFVNDISQYFLGSDLFINPVIEGGGIKTKLVEALGYNLTSISSDSGAYGIPEKIATGKLNRIKDFDWDAFAEAIIHADLGQNISDEFYKHFYWGEIGKRMASVLEKI